ncbi:hypothetical protein NM688_g3258 [Phlebia brevispora]|uniref:Uncharacterized protein n=1 Tax=Phlebia brevispora TaxID=194682 RepID=A0ACC1T6E3_9APHY|nr:hypothetical protein NM688_g3258 [Phlebia brevispora]
MASLDWILQSYIFVLEMPDGVNKILVYTFYSLQADTKSASSSSRIYKASAFELSTTQLVRFLLSTTHSYTQIMAHNQTTTHHPLPDGHYTIVSQASDYVVGRKLAEDYSLLPKGIFTLHPAAHNAEDVKHDWNFLWQFEQIHDGLYKLKAVGDPVGNRGGLLYAFLTEYDQHYVGKWSIVPVPQMGKDAYLIKLHDTPLGWVASGEKAPKNEQIEVRVLIRGPSEPPRYPTTQVFIIKPAKPQSEHTGLSELKTRRQCELRSYYVRSRHLEQCSIYTIHEHEVTAGDVFTDELREEISTKLTGVLAQAGVGPIVLWGEWAMMYYGIPTIYNHMHLLVPDDQLETAYRTLLAAGYKDTPSVLLPVTNSHDPNTRWARLGSPAYRVAHDNFSKGPSLFKILLQNYSAARSTFSDADPRAFTSMQGSPCRAESLGSTTRWRCIGNVAIERPVLIRINDLRHLPVAHAQLLQ